MNKNVLITISVIIAIGILGFAFYKYYPMGKTNINNTPVTGNSVNIQNYTFTPNNLSVKVGDRVTWTNNDGFAHHVKSDVLDSGVLNNGDTYSFTFKNAGTYTYHCVIHTYMTGQIVVQ